MLFLSLAACDALLGDFTLQADAGKTAVDARTDGAVRTGDATMADAAHREAGVAEAGPDAALEAARTDAPDAVTDIDATRLDGSPGDAGRDVSPNVDTGVDAGCPAGQRVCNDGGACVSPDEDPHNCGACGRSCLTGANVDPATTKCSMGRCEYACMPGFTTPCDGGAAADDAGCPTSLSTLENCGACGKACGPETACSADSGACVTSCGALTLCGTACVDTKNDPSACGASCTVCEFGCFDGGCGGDCLPGSVTCSGKAATVTCGPSYTWGSAVACPISGEVCASGVCACAAGMTACGATCVNEQTDSDNCGGCGNVCPIVDTCQAGKCVFL